MPQHDGSLRRGALASGAALITVAGLVAAARVEVPDPPATATPPATPVAAAPATGPVVAAGLDRPGSPPTRADVEAAAVSKARAAQQVQQAQQARLVRVRAAAAARDRAAAAAARAAQHDPRSAARSLLAERGLGADQFTCLDALWAKESGWKHTARNPSSGAFGIPQALPAEKLAKAGADWRTNPVTQIRWGLDYIEGSYGSPCAAWAHSRAVNWY